MSTPRVVTVRGDRRLTCRCGRGYLGQLPVGAEVNRDGICTVTWWCKSCRQTTSCTFSLKDVQWTGDDSPVQGNGG